MIAILLAMLGAAPASTSVYTQLDFDRCRVTSRAAEGEGSFVNWRCPGYARVPLIVHADDDRFDLDAGVDNENWQSLSPFNTLGPRVEWRVRARRPIAVIYRYIVSTPGIPAFSRIAVASIGRAGHPGCLIALIDGALPNANSLARDRADHRAERFRCGVDRAEGQSD
jgi:hypothetical protein